MERDHQDTGGFAIMGAAFTTPTSENAGNEHRTPQQYMVVAPYLLPIAGHAIGRPTNRNELFAYLVRYFRIAALWLLSCGTSNSAILSTCNLPRLAGGLGTLAPQAGLRLGRFCDTGDFSARRIDGVAKSACGCSIIWHETRLEAAISMSRGDIFSMAIGMSIFDFVAQHLRFATGPVSSGGYFASRDGRSQAITRDDIVSRLATDPAWLVARGVPKSPALSCGWSHASRCSMLTRVRHRNVPHPEAGADLACQRFRRTNGM